MSSAVGFGGWAPQRYSAAGHCRDTRDPARAVGPCRDTLWLGIAGIFCGWPLGILCGWTLGKIARVGFTGILDDYSAVGLQDTAGHARDSWTLWGWALCGVQGEQCFLKTIQDPCEVGNKWETS